MKKFKILERILQSLLGLLLLFFLGRAAYYLGDFLISKATIKTSYDVALECQKIKANEYRHEEWKYDDCIRQLRNALPTAPTILHSI